ncbi:hypothetical protein [Pannonibacter tanglangensis]|nr:hypothetical protein [Pannonibacter sp. XCT-34]
MLVLVLGGAVAPGLASSRAAAAAVVVLAGGQLSAPASSPGTGLAAGSEGDRASDPVPDPSGDQPAGPRPEAAGPEAARCPAQPADTRLLQVHTVARDGTLQVDDGRMIRLVGVEMTEEGRAWLIGQPLHVLPTGPEDRWSRLPAVAFLPPDAGLPPQRLQDQLLAQGLAVWTPEARAAGCLAAFGAAEATARGSAVGLWRAAGSATRVPENPAASLRQRAGQPERVLARAGRFALVEGRIESLGKSRQTRYLNFGRSWASDFTVTFSSSLEGQLVAAGLDPARLTGAVVRVRGVVQTRDGPHIEVTDVAQIERAE